ncbi:hypothetical protein B296_00032601 [Ensete ventricosum]|uniref:Uncharacterized protein n=1 Tax=Ensete ventricosum TaxID=4639 RepID=A0A426ZY51_ENSVE|nr:hypothetical protein B296_00032601 [Ensete ventricosum]
MRLGTHQECSGSSSRVSRVCQDGVREFARRRLRLTGRLPRVAEKLVGSWYDDGPRSSLGIGLGLDDTLGPHREFARRFTEGIRKLAGSTPGDHRKKTG